MKAFVKPPAGQLAGWYRYEWNVAPGAKDLPTQAEAYRIDVLKLDGEGAEREISLGAHAIIQISGGLLWGTHRRGIGGGYAGPADPLTS